MHAQAILKNAEKKIAQAQDNLGDTQTKHIDLKGEQLYSLDLPNGEQVLLRYQEDAVTLCTHSAKNDGRTILQVTGGRAWFATGVDLL